MATRTIKKMLENLPVGMVDVVRLFVEAAEEGGLMGKTRGEVIAGFRRVVRAGAKAVQEEERTLPFGVVVRRSLELRAGRRKSTVYDLRSYAGRMVRHKDWEEKPLRGIGVEECREMLQEVFGHSEHALRKARAILHSLFAFGMRQGWCARNPVDAIDAPQVVEKRIEPLTGAQIARLMAACKEPGMRDMEPAVVLMLWCGVRPAEVQRLTWADVDVQEGVIYIPPQHSKTGGARLVPLRGAAARLRAGGGGTAAIAPRNWAKRWRKLRTRAGFLDWQQDTLRHTFASYHLRRFCNPPQLQAEMGHRNCALLRTRYLNLNRLTAKSASRFWAA